MFNPLGLAYVEHVEKEEPGEITVRIWTPQGITKTLYSEFPKSSLLWFTRKFKYPRTALIQFKPGSVYIYPANGRLFFIAKVEVEGTESIVVTVLSDWELDEHCVNKAYLYQPGPDVSFEEFEPASRFERIENGK